MALYMDAFLLYRQQRMTHLLSFNFLPQKNDSEMLLKIRSKWEEEILHHTGTSNY